MQHYTILIIDDKREQAKEIKKKIEALHPAFYADIANGDKSIAVPIYKIHKVSVIKKQLCLDMGNTRYTYSCDFRIFSAYTMIILSVRKTVYSSIRPAAITMKRGIHCS